MKIEAFSKCDPELWTHYKKNGYVLIDNLFSISELNCVSEDLREVFCNGFNIGKNDQSLEEILLLTYLKDISLWKACATRLWDSFSVNNLYSSHSVKEVMKKLRIQNPIYSTRPEVRIDMPGDNQYRQDSHQDFCYGQSSLNSITVWTPLHDVNVSNGTVQIFPGSHLEGLREVTVLKNPRRFQINDTLDETKFVDIEIPFGVSVIFSQFTIHRSGTNSSKSPRLSFQGRYADLSDAHFRDKNYYQPEKDNISITNFPSVEEVKGFFSE
jgi:hypothetical protein